MYRQRTPQKRLAYLEENQRGRTDLQGHHHVISKFHLWNLHDASNITTSP